MTKGLSKLKIKFKVKAKNKPSSNRMEIYA